MKNVQDMIAAIHNLNSRLQVVEGVVKQQGNIIKELKAEMVSLQEHGTPEIVPSGEADLVDGEEYVD